ncbi:MAG: hypothetical protein M1829_006509 [Trizodia sp. TS-e1964]|nr:MAG: hypothetical protein M1829_006509 [Trizodia sp. TS-e1964]
MADSAGQKGALPLPKLRTTPFNATSGPNRKPMVSANGTAQSGLRPEDQKDSPEYKKKQAMLAGPILNMGYENARNYGMKESLFSALKDIFEAMVAHESRTGIVSPQRFLDVLKQENEMFRSSMHQDAHEFLNLLLNEVVSNVENTPEEVTTKEDHPTEAQNSLLATGTNSPASGWVHDLFEGTLTSETKCLTCENTSHRDEPFLDLSVDLDQHSSVTSCLKKFSEEEMLCERNKFHCDKCGGLQEAEKRMKIKRLPKILALHLKRFKYTEDLQRLQKLFHRVVYPYHLRLFNTTDDAEDPDRLYELYAVVVHIGGGPYHGHYVSIIKTQDRGWLLFDDEMVEPVDKNYVRNFFGERPGLACAYVLFYQETTLEAVQKEQEAEGLAAYQKLWAAKEILTSPSKSPGILQNGLRHYVQSTASPTSPAENSADSASSTSSPPILPEAPRSPPSEVDINAPPLPPKSKKDRAKEEKELKVAEKEKERAQKKKAKEEESIRKELQKKQEADLRAAAISSNQSKLAEDHSASLSTEKPQEISTPITNGKSGNGLNRFRLGSKSISKKKVAFWSSKDKEKPPEAPEMPEAKRDRAPSPEMEKNDIDLPEKEAATVPVLPPPKPPVPMPGAAPVFIPATAPGLPTLPITVQYPDKSDKSEKTKYLLNSFGMLRKKASKTLK